MNFIWFVIGFWVGLYVGYLNYKDHINSIRRMAGYTVVLSAMLFTDDKELAKGMYETIENRKKEEMIKMIKDTVITEDTKLSLIQEIRSW